MRPGEHFIAFSQLFNKFNNIGAGMLDFIYPMTLKLLNRIIGVKTSRFLLSFMQHYNGRHYVKLLICKPLVVYRFMC